MDTILDIDNLSKSFTLHATHQVIHANANISLKVAEGEFVAITGKSGSGKSTILKSIYRTNKPQTGSIVFKSLAYGKIDLSKATDREIIYLRRFEIGYVSQFLRMMPRTTAFDYVAQSLLEMRISDREINQRVTWILNHFELSESLWSLYPNTFSGGEKLRLNIAAAMIKKPRLLLLDEPTASLDMKSKEKVRVLIEQLKQDGTSMIGIFHDLDFMEGLYDRRYHIEGGTIHD